MYHQLQRKGEHSTRNQHLFSGIFRLISRGLNSCPQQQLFKPHYAVVLLNGFNLFFTPFYTILGLKSLFPLSLNSSILKGMHFSKGHCYIRLSANSFSKEIIFDNEGFLNAINFPRSCVDFYRSH